MSDPYAGISKRVSATADPYAGIAKPAVKAKSSAWDQIGAFAQSATERIPFLDEAAAGVVALGTGKPYKEVRQVQQRLAAEDRRERPTARNAGGIAGTVPLLAAPGAGWLGGARSLGSAAFRGATLGGGYGALSGAADAQGGVKERAKGAAQGAAFGATVGGALPVAASGAQTAMRAADNMTGGVAGRLLGGYNARAADRLRQALRRDGVDENSIRAGMAEWQRTGSPPPRFLDLAGENTRALLHFAGTRPGEASNTLRGIGRATRANMPMQVRARTQQLTPDAPMPANQAVADAREAREMMARVNYREPYTTPVQVPETVQDMLRDPAGRSLISRARADAIENGDWAMQRELDALLAPVENGQLPRVSAGTLDRLSIAARERASAMTQRGLRNRARGALGRRDQLEEVLEQVPQIQPARADYRNRSQFIEGVENIGPNVLRETGDNFAPQLEALAPADPLRQGAQIGGRQAISDLFGKGPARARGALDLIADGIDPQRNLRALYGEQPADDYIAAMRNTRDQVDNAMRVDPLSGSKTHVSGEDAKNVGGIVSLIRGDWIQPLAERFARGLTLTDQEAAILARVGIDSPEAALRAIQPGPVARTRGLFGSRLGVAAPASIGALTGP